MTASWEESMRRGRNRRGVRLAGVVLAATVLGTLVLGAVRGTEQDDALGAAPAYATSTTVSKGSFELAAAGGDGPVTIPPTSSTTPPPPPATTTSTSTTTTTTTLPDPVVPDIAAVTTFCGFGEVLRTFIGIGEVSRSEARVAVTRLQAVLPVYRSIAPAEVEADVDRVVTRVTELASLLERSDWNPRAPAFFQAVEANSTDPAFGESYDRIAFWEGIAC